MGSKISYCWNLIKKPWVLIGVLNMDPTILGFLYQVPTEAQGFLIRV